ncbi:MAG: hypothetical protein R2730_09170 [Chitinophagales bacterium]
MKTFLLDIIPRVKQYSKKFNSIALLTNQHWVVLDEIFNSKTVYIFQKDGRLYISKDGKVEKNASWEYLGADALLLDIENNSYLFRHGFFDENVLVLKLDGKDEYAVMVNETKFNEKINSILDIENFLKKKYLPEKSPSPLPKPPNEFTHKPNKGERRVVLRSNIGWVIIYTKNRTTYQFGDRVYLNNSIPLNGKLPLLDGKCLVIKDGVIVSSLKF